jgi:GrpB-like predicted nucleotidyltransferase (UPF0157 family)
MVRDHRLIFRFEPILLDAALCANGSLYQSPPPRRMDLIPTRRRNRMTFEKPALGLRQASLSLVEYDPRWAVLFQEEAALISRTLPDLVFGIDHIGSTSVPGLIAKPILDIAIRSNDEEQIASALTGLGYIDRGIRSGRLFIRLRDGDIRTHNLHLYQRDDVDYREQIAFRDALRLDHSLRDQYAALKLRLAEELGDQGRGQYAGRKSDFIRAAISAFRT